MAELGKYDVVRSLDFGDYVAEDEKQELSKYFIETFQWQMVYSGESDIVLGLKGAGKSAIFYLLEAHKNDLRKRNIFLRLAESYENDPVFTVLLERSPQTELEWEGFWKLYFLSLAGDIIKDFAEEDEVNYRVTSRLRQEGLLQSDMSLASVIRRILDYLKRIKFDGIEAGVHLNELSGAAQSVYARIRLTTAEAQRFSGEVVTVDQMIKDVRDLLSRHKRKIWIVLDRLDTAFRRREGLEKQALRSLLIVYKDHFRKSPFSLKIFMRKEVFQRIMREGFTEATHLSSQLDLKWTSKDVAHLIVRRLCNSTAFIDFYEVRRDALLRNFGQQMTLLNEVLEKSFSRARVGNFNRIVDRLTDGTGNTQPRDVIMFFKNCRDAEVQRYIRGEPAIGDGTLFHFEAVASAFEATSKSKLEYSIIAEYPDLEESIRRLSRVNGPAINVKNLAKLWGVREVAAEENTKRLIELGVLRTLNEKTNSYAVARVFGPALGISEAPW
jgi:hypothetical protein